MQARDTTCILTHIADPHTDPRLLPQSMLSQSNERRIRHYKIALEEAMDCCISQTQRKQIYLFYWQGMRKTDIAKKMGVGPSAVSKSLQAAEKALHEYIQRYMTIFERIEQEFLNEAED